LRALRLSLPLVLSALAFALGLLACGGGESDEDKVAEAIETTFIGNDPGKCTEVVTQAFIEQVEMSKGKEAVEQCEEGVREDEPADSDSVEVSDVRIDGSAATADVAFAGGSYDGQVLAIALVEEDGAWKPDRIAGFVRLDKDQLASSLERAFEADDAPGPAVQACFGDVIRERTKPEMEEIMFGGSLDLVLAIIEGCSQGSAEPPGRSGSSAAG
jgi:hypothetical protein